LDVAHRGGEAEHLLADVLVVDDDHVLLLTAREGEHRVPDVVRALAEAVHDLHLPPASDDLRGWHLRSGRCMRRRRRSPQRAVRVLVGVLHVGRSLVER
jgi:hypothetical protein